MTVLQHLRTQCLSQRFYSKTTWNKGCLEWTGTISNNGYGEFKINGQKWGAHRIAFMLKLQSYLPKGLNVCHKCDNKKCVFSDHLFLATWQENMQDKVKKGRTRGATKLTEEQVKQIRLAVGKGAMQNQVALQYGVAKSTICNLLKKRTYKYVLE